jgi:hypothetical protein
MLAGSLGASLSSTVAAVLSLLTRLEPTTENFAFAGHHVIVLLARAPSTYSCLAGGSPAGVFAVQMLPAVFFQAAPAPPILTPPETVPPTMWR